MPRPTTRRVGGEPLRDQALLQWCAELLKDVLGEVPAAGCRRDAASRRGVGGVRSQSGRERVIDHAACPPTRIHRRRRAPSPSSACPPAGVRARTWPPTSATLARSPSAEVERDLRPRRSDELTAPRRRCRSEPPGAVRRAGAAGAAADHQQDVLQRAGRRRRAGPGRARRKGVSRPPSRPSSRSAAGRAAAGRPASTCSSTPSRRTAARALLASRPHPGRADRRRPARRLRPARGAGGAGGPTAVRAVQPQLLGRGQQALAAAHRRCATSWRGRRETYDVEVNPRYRPPSSWSTAAGRSRRQRAGPRWSSVVAAAPTPADDRRSSPDVDLMSTPAHRPAGHLAPAAGRAADRGGLGPGPRRTRSSPPPRASQADGAAARPASTVTVLDRPTPQALLAAVGRRTARWSGWPARPATRPSPASSGLRLAREPGLAELELMYGSWDPPGARLLDAVAVMDRLASPGGDPWKRAADPPDASRRTCSRRLRGVRRDRRRRPRRAARGAGRRAAAGGAARPAGRGAAETSRWNVDDVAGDLVDKMIRRNPHVFAGDAGRGHRGDHRQLGADQAGGEGARLGAGRHRAEPAGAGAGREGPAPGRGRARCRARRAACRADERPRRGAAARWSPRRARPGLDAEAALRRAALLRRASAPRRHGC